MGKFFKTIAFSAALLLSGAADAGLILSFDSSSQSSNKPATGASAKVLISFSDIAGNSEDVLIDLTIENTTGLLAVFGDGATTSKLTGVAFDLVAPNTGIAEFSGGSFLDTKIDNASLQPFGTFHIGVADNNNFLGGNANNALAEGGSDMASFILKGVNMNAADLESAFASGFNSGSLGYVARFQQVNAGAGSDKLNGGTCTGCGPTDPDPPTPVPEPSILVLLGAGFFGMGWSRRLISNRNL